MNIRGGLAAFALLIAAPAASADAPLSPSAFRDRLAASMTAETGFPAKPVDDRTFVTKNGEGTELTIFIDNAYQQYLSQPEQLDAVIQRFTAVFTAKEQTAGLDQLTVIVRPSDYLTQTLSAGASLASFPAPRPLAGDLSTFLAVDSLETVRIANIEDLTRWGLTEEQAWIRAVGSIKVRVGPLGFAQLEGEPNSSALVADSGLAPSVLADPAFCGPEKRDGLDGAIVLLMSRDALLFGFPKEKASIESFWRVAKSEIKAKTSLSSTPIACRDGRWESGAVPGISGVGPNVSFI